MSKEYEIRYLGTAEKDLVDIFDYIRQDNPSAAATLLDKFDRAIAGLAINPFLGVIPTDERLKKLGYRVLILNKYLVFYVVKTDTIQIRRIIHGARQFGFLL